MTVDLKHEATEIEEPHKTQERTDLSRRTFLALTILGVGCAAGTTLGVREAVATTTETTEAGKAKDLAETDAAGKAKHLADDKATAEGKKAELVDGVDPDDPLEISAQTRGMARRRVRRTTRQVRRVDRRVSRRVRRRVP